MAIWICCRRFEFAVSDLNLLWAFGFDMTAVGHRTPVLVCYILSRNLFWPKHLSQWDFTIRNHTSYEEFSALWKRTILLTHEFVFLNKDTAKQLSKWLTWTNDGVAGERLKLLPDWSNITRLISFLKRFTKGGQIAWNRKKPITDKRQLSFAKKIDSI